MSEFLSRTDSQLREDVISEMRWDPSVTSSLIKVNANDGIVTLSGTVPHYVEKGLAEIAAQRVNGVKAVADELNVKCLQEKSDEDIARAALSTLNWSYSVPDEVKVTVENGWVTLIGETEWDFQRTAAMTAVSELQGVVGVTNNVTLKSNIQSGDIKARIQDALKRTAESEGKTINVAVNGNKVTLTGHVHSFSEKGDAGLAAWNAPGVMNVQNDISISH